MNVVEQGLNYQPFFYIHEKVGDKDLTKENKTINAIIGPKMKATAIPPKIRCSGVVLLVCKPEIRLARFINNPCLLIGLALALLVEFLSYEVIQHA